MTDSERLDYLEAHGIPIKSEPRPTATGLESEFYAWDYPQYKNRRFRSLRDAIDARIAGKHRKAPPEVDVISSAPH